MILEIDRKHPLVLSAEAAIELREDIVAVGWGRVKDIVFITGDELRLSASSLALTDFQAQALVRILLASHKYAAGQLVDASRRIIGLTNRLHALNLQFQPELFQPEQD